ncbi:hypothetical protein RDWZM_000456 [Blomia tropicalis]|uniref:tRNA-dihydrouridine(16/17) synthase [NAD(P)(+)] n=1 Tax=Blomia tropicalis TaxID=40697 RepID=A0A9Q0M9M3_BLOTA|nr:hypothetical protein RDWZM_000456 [Blomia tropicalis]
MDLNLENNKINNDEINMVSTIPSTINYEPTFWRDILQSSRYILAPMVDQSELAFRLYVRQHGVQCTYSPMFNAGLFVKDHKYRRECLQVLPELDKPMIIQFCANKPETFLEAAKIAEPFCEAIDLNLGCPQIIAKRGHYGAFLQDEWELIYEMVNQTSKAITKPVTCKIRVFEDKEKTIRYAKMIEQAGASLIGVHGRYREQKGPVTGLASWDHIKAVKEALSIPVFANGNIQSYKDVHQCLNQLKVDGVMSAEGILHNPTIFTGKAITIWDAMRGYLKIAQIHTPQFSYIRGHVFKFLHHCLLLEEHEQLRRIVGKTHSIDHMIDVANKLEQRYQNEYEQYVLEHPEIKNDKLEAPLPDTLPIYFCKPYYRPPPTQLNSKIEGSTNQVPEGNKQQLEKVKGFDSNTKLSKRQRKKLEKFVARKRQKNDVEIDELGKEIDLNQYELPVKRKIELCVQCPNPRGVKCEFDFCKTCCRIKTHEEVLDCLAHRFDVKSRQMKIVSQTNAVTN